MATGAWASTRVDADSTPTGAAVRAAPHAWVGHGRGPGQCGAGRTGPDRVQGPRCLHCSAAAALWRRRSARPVPYSPGIEPARRQGSIKASPLVCACARPSADSVRSVGIVTSRRAGLVGGGRVGRTGRGWAGAPGRTAHRPCSVGIAKPDFSREMPDFSQNYFFWFKV
jgi:hypothetical protein